MSGTVTKDDLRDAKDDLRREFTAQIDGVRGVFTEKFDGLKWRLLIGFAGNIAAVIGGVYATRNPNQATEPAVNAMRAIGRAVGVI